MANEIIKLQDWYAAQCEMTLFSTGVAPGVSAFFTFRNGRYVEKFREGGRMAPWQHDHGTDEIYTTDKPGWKVILTLIKTPLEDAILSPIEINNGPDDWMRCEIKDKKFIGEGDPLKLVTILDQFFRVKPPPSSPRTRRPVRKRHRHSIRSRRTCIMPAQPVTEFTEDGPDGILHKLVLIDGVFQDIAEIPNPPRIFGSQTTRDTSDAFDRLQQWYAAQCKIYNANARCISIETGDNPDWQMHIELTGTELQNATMEPIEFDNGDYDWLQLCKISRENNRVRFGGVGDPSKLVVMLDHFFALQTQS